VDNPNDFFSWLAVQPPCVEVALGALFCLIVAPAFVAGVAMGVTALEAFAETRLIQLFASLRTQDTSLTPKPALSGRRGASLTA
jgi:hypothetical protein